MPIEEEELIYHFNIIIPILDKKEINKIIIVVENFKGNIRESIFLF